ncbi:hypothetical protein VP01_1252g2 [Puccinia sorghi]|uniref:AB hydrolase-1 domain-containing protein n=1 Tax=Puccinia sorghi TaxID=27349 RepID=A0A0L6VPD4_9BASI|nr:hypothetical protein VP01_1252g2 [Puccinia sorghi]
MLQNTLVLGWRQALLFLTRYFSPSSQRCEAIIMRWWADAPPGVQAQPKAGSSFNTTILNPKTCVQKGLCPASADRDGQPRNLYYEVHGDLEASQKLVLNGLELTKIKNFCPQTHSPHLASCCMLWIENIYRIITGLMFTCAAWSEQVDHFSQKVDHAVLVMDNRGVGNSECGSWAPYRTAGMAQDVKCVLDFVGWVKDRSLHIFGVSLGGMIAQNLVLFIYFAWCLLIPKRIKSISFVSTRCGSVFDMPSVSSQDVLLKATFGIRRKESFEKRLDLLFELLYPPSFLNQSVASGKIRRDELLTYYQTWFDDPQLPNAGIFGQFCAAGLHHCPDAKLEQVAADLQPAKIMVITGDRDKLVVPLRSLELSQKLPGSELVVFRDAGHLLCSQVPQQFNRLMERIIDEGNQAF